ncbi:MAG: dihydrolipoyl dehydrogenase [Rhodobacteraceae bacterium]|nr:MAG: dihydrolipoyl dehydrogenase [Paracoccaceae bacterium]
MKHLTCDVAVIGAGTAGLAAQSVARKAGAQVLLIDPAYSGTTCATVGCMPSKLLIAAADAAHGVRTAETFGIRATAEVDGPAVMARVRKLRDHFVAGVTRAIDRLPEEVRITARASFSGPGTLDLDDGRSVAARAVVIATGARPAIPGPFKAVSEHILTNESLFEMTDLPRSVAVIGAGALGLEMAQALHRLGVRVEVFDMGETVAGLRDAAVSEVLRDLLKAEMPLHLGVKPEVSPEPEGVTISWEGRSRDFQHLLVAAGRPANLDGLHLERAGIDLGEDGMPGIDPETLRCGETSVFIAGDANGHMPLLHEASHEGCIAGRNAAAFPEITRFARHVPFVLTFTRPEAAQIGTIPDEDGSEIVTASASYEDQGRARVEARLGGLCRIHARRSDGRLTGASLCAPDAGHLGHLFALAIDAGLSAGDLLAMPFYHPTLEEGLKPALRALCEQVDQPHDASRQDDAPCA